MEQMKAILLDLVSVPLFVVVALAGLLFFAVAMATLIVVMVLALPIGVLLLVLMYAMDFYDTKKCKICGARAIHSHNTTGICTTNPECRQAYMQAVRESAKAYIDKLYANPS